MLVSVSELGQLASTLSAASQPRMAKNFLFSPLTSHARMSYPGSGIRHLEFTDPQAYADMVCAKSEKHDPERVG